LWYSETSDLRFVSLLCISSTGDSNFLTDGNKAVI
jgi:hypothetical protein